MMWSTILKNLAMSAIPSIIEVGKKFFEKILDAPQMTQKNTVDDIEQISKALGELREHILQESKPAIDNASDSITSYLEEQLFLLEDKKDLLAKYEISSRSVEHKMQEINRRLGNFWHDAIYKKISLDDSQCRAILTLPSGEKKNAELANFTNKVLSETLNDYAELVREELSKIYVDFEDEISRSVSRLENSVREYSEIVQSMDEKDDDKFEMLIANAKLKVFCYDVMLAKVSD